MDTLKKIVSVGESRQKEIVDKLANQHGVGHHWIHFTNEKRADIDIIYSEYVESVHCTLYFWINPKFMQNFSC